MAEVNKKQRVHFVLVHGACHGAWSWYKVKPLLEASCDHRVTAVDLEASGSNMAKSIEDVHTFYDYTKPLLDFLSSLPQNDHEKVVLVGHSLGGLSLALAMETYTKKIGLAVFSAAFMPDIAHQPSFVLEQYNERTPAEAWLDTEFSPYGGSHQQLSSMFFGPKFLESKLYQLTPPEDLELGKKLVRPSSLFMHDLSKSNKFTSEGYGSVPKAYIVCKEDKGIPLEFQRWMISNGGVHQVMEIENADHMPMFSAPLELCHCLIRLAKMLTY